MAPETEHLAVYLMGRLQLTPECALETTRAVIDALEYHLWNLLATLERSGRLSPEEMAELRHGIADAMLGNALQAQK